METSEEIYQNANLIMLEILRIKHDHYLTTTFYTFCTALYLTQ